MGKFGLNWAENGPVASWWARIRESLRNVLRKGWFCVSDSAYKDGTWGDRAFRSLPFDALVLWEFQENPKHPLRTGTVERASWNDLAMTENQPTSEITLYLAEDGTTRVEVRLQNETVWLTLAQMADLFQRDKSSIFKHVQNSFAEDELSSPSALVESTRSELYCICQRSP